MPMRTIRAPNVNVVTVLSPQMITLSSRLEHVNISAIQTQVCELYGGNHTSVNCQVGGLFAWSPEQAHYVSNFQRQQNNLHSNAYNPGWRNHSNLL